MAVLVVGAGIAGVACARALQGAGVAVTVRDRGRVPAGRMATRTEHGRLVDTGASYFTVSGAGFGAVVGDWLRSGLARPWTDTFASLHVGTGAMGSKPGPLRYAAVGGLRSLVTALAAGLDIRQADPVGTVGAGPIADGDAWDFVVLAMPGPQASRLLAPGLAAEHRLCAVERWEAVLAISAGYDQLDLADGTFVNGDPVLSFVAHDGLRRGDGAPVLVAHTTGAFAADHLDDPSAAVPVVLRALDAAFGLGQPQWNALQRWTYARPTSGHEPPWHLGESGVGLCGDAWGASPKVESAWASGDGLGREIARRLAG